MGDTEKTTGGSTTQPSSNQGGSSSTNERTANPPKDYSIGRSHVGNTLNKSKKKDRQ